MLTIDALANIGNRLLKDKGLKVTSCEILQNLWAGYGHICRIQAVSSNEEDTDKEEQVLIIKVVLAPVPVDPDEGHYRKLISYQVEQHFYEVFAPQLPNDVAVAKCISGVNEPKICTVPIVAMAMTDLREKFPVEGEKRGELNETQVYAALRWLAGFHGFWWGKVEGLDRKRMRLPPLEEVKEEKKSEIGQNRVGLWLNGGYTYLATRRTEYESLKKDQDSEWSHLLCSPTFESKGKKTTAEVVAQILAPSRKPSSSSPIAKYETIIHGDVKSENLFTTDTGTEVAFFDFQYVGLGLAVCDLAKLFTCSVPFSLLADPAQIPSSLEMREGERKLLEYYQQTMQSVSGKDYPWDDLLMHWKTALVDWLRFQASWGFWGNTEWLEARVRHILVDQEWRAWVAEMAEQKR